MKRILRFLVTAALLMGAVFVCANESTYLHGKFVRADLVTDDLVVSRKFYSGLFGWAIIPYKDHATIISGDRELGSIVERKRPDDGKVRPVWVAMMSVPDVALIRQKVLAAGGEVKLEPQNVRDLGTVGVFSDPEGALFGAIRSTQGDPDDYIADIGTWIWIELFSHDARKAGNFYADIAGYEVWDYEPRSERLRDRTNLLLSSEGYARAAISEFAKDRVRARSVWLPFVRVENTGQTLRRAQELDGRVIVAPSPDLFNGRVAVLADPRGAVIGIMEWDEDNASEEGER